jgi:hypothetical protein
MDSSKVSNSTLLLDGRLLSCCCTARSYLVRRKPADLEQAATPSQPVLNHREEARTAGAVIARHKLPHARRHRHERSVQTPSPNACHLINRDAYFRRRLVRLIKEA